MDIQITLAIKG